jgi:hypothetical protein
VQKNRFAQLASGTHSLKWVGYNSVVNCYVACYDVYVLKITLRIVCPLTASFIVKSGDNVNCPELTTRNRLILKS